MRQLRWSSMTDDMRLIATLKVLEDAETGDLYLDIEKGGKHRLIEANAIVVVAGEADDDWRGNATDGLPHMDIVSFRQKWLSLANVHAWARNVMDAKVISTHEEALDAARN